MSSWVRTGAPRCAHRFLLNFSASYYGGGHKRLYEYARWFDANGGASFIIHPRCARLQEAFPTNRYFVVTHSNWQRLLDDWTYLEQICCAAGRPEVYYAYGVPVYRAAGTVNWSHVNNILTIGRHDCPLPLAIRVKCKILGARIQRGFARAQVISAESRFSLEMLESAGYENVYLAPNGADDELTFLNRPPPPAEDIVTVVGTHCHKGLRDCLPVFRMLRQERSNLKLLVIGEPLSVPGSVRNHPETRLLGALPRAEVIEYLRRSRFYISTTLVENSWNAASEGIFLAERSVISDIPPHAELLAGERSESITVQGLSRAMVRVERSGLKGVNLRSWDDLISEMVAKAYALLSRPVRGERAEPIRAIA